jgi:hypothetical protein
MADQRVEFISTTFGPVISSFFAEGLIEVPPNPYACGNCPEMIIWGIVCQRPGRYNSLCINVPGRGNVINNSIQYCGYCNKLSNLLSEMRIEITDWWAKTSLRNPAKKPVVDNEDYPYHELLSNQDILTLF